MRLDLPRGLQTNDTVAASPRPAFTIIALVQFERKAKHTCIVEGFIRTIQNFNRSIFHEINE